MNQIIAIILYFIKPKLPKFVWYEILIYAELIFNFRYDLLLYASKRIDKFLSSNVVIKKLNLRMSDQDIKERVWPENLMIKSCFYGNKELFWESIKLGAKELNHGFYYACKGGQLTFVKFLLKQESCKELSHRNKIFSLPNIVAHNFGTNVDYGLYIACKYEQLHIVKYLYENYKCNLELGLFGAAKGGHLKLIKKLIKCGAKKIGKAFYTICKYNHPDLIEFFVNKGVNNYDNCLYIAHARRHKKVIEKLLQVHNYREKYLVKLFSV